MSDKCSDRHEELCKRFGVSEMTIRRDLSELEKEDLLIRTHGGAKLKETAFFELSFAAKATQFSPHVQFRLPKMTGATHDYC